MSSITDDEIRRLIQDTNTIQQAKIQTARSVVDKLHAQTEELLQAYQTNHQVKIKTVPAAPDNHRCCTIS